MGNRTGVMLWGKFVGKVMRRFEGSFRKLRENAEQALEVLASRLTSRGV